VQLIVGIAAFGGGVWLLVESVEGLIGSLRAWALASGVSGIVVGALVLGFDVESTAAGVAATLDDLPGTALGATVGAAIFLVTVGLGVAALIAPFRVRPPAAMLGAGAVATVLCIALAADGRLTRLDGGLLLAAFVPLVAAIVIWRPRAAEPEADSGEPGERPRFLVLRVLAGLAGLVVGAELLVFGTRRVVDELGLSETVFGLLVIGAAVSFEEVVLEALPAFRGFPELSVGNALGTLVFLLSGSLGVIALVRPLDVPASVADYHLPALGLTVLLALGLLARGRLGRLEGVVLVLAYAAYAVGAVLR
jgi:cation:H+ antiporter